MRKIHRFASLRMYSQLGQVVNNMIYSIQRTEKKRLHKKEQSLRDLWKNVRCTMHQHTCNGSSKRKEKTEKGAKTFWRNTSPNFPKSGCFSKGWTQSSHDPAFPFLGIAIITLNVNGENSTIKRQRPKEFMKITRPTYMWSMRNTLQM